MIRFLIDYLNQISKIKVDQKKTQSIKTPNDINGRKPPHIMAMLLFFLIGSIYKFTYPMWIS